MAGLSAEQGFTTWVAPTELSRSWLPRFFAPEFRALDLEMQTAATPLRQLAELVAVAVGSRPLEVEEEVDWVVRPRRGELAMEPWAESRSRSGLLRLPPQALLVSRFVTSARPALYWDESLFRGTGATTPEIVVLTSPHGGDIAWLEEELRTRQAVQQMRRQAVGATLPRISTESLLSLQVSSPTVEQQQAMGRRVRTEAERRRQFPMAPSVVATLTGATFEERLAQFERMILEQGVVDRDSAYFIEAATQDVNSELFVVRSLGDAAGAFEARPGARLTPQDDPPTSMTWRDWYWSTDVNLTFELFNALDDGPRLPPFLLARTLAHPRLGAYPVTGEFTLPSFASFVACIVGHFGDGGIDLEAAADDVLAMWRRLNGGDANPEEVFVWLRRVFRPALAVRVLRANKVAGAFLFFGPDQLDDPAATRAHLEFLGARLSEVLQVPAVVSEDLARKESLRRLSWMGHQIAGPLMRMDRVVNELNEFFAENAGLGGELLPNEEAARNQADMNDEPIENYSIAGRLAVLTETVADMRRLKYQISRFKRSQRDLQKSCTSVSALIERIASKARAQLSSTAVSCFVEGDCYAQLDEEVIGAAFEEVVNNAARELQVQQPADPQLIFRAKSSPSTVTVSVEDNGLPLGSSLPDDPFAEDASNYTSTGKGTGLGLAIVRESFHRHGGRCRLEVNRDLDGERRGGVTFAAELPAAQDTEGEENADV
jgi:signal transduction histidine kinase